MLDTAVTAAAGLIGVAFGGYLSERRDQNQRSRTRSDALGRVLTYLLEIRFTLLFLPKYLQFLEENFDIDDDILLASSAVLPHFLPNTAPAPETFESALDPLSGTDPLLTYRLRSNPHLPALLTTIRRMISLGPRAEAAALLRQSDRLLPQAIEETISGLALDVAWAHGLYTWWRTRRLLRRHLFDTSAPRFQGLVPLIREALDASRRLQISAATGTQDATSSATNTASEPLPVTNPPEDSQPAVADQPVRDDRDCSSGTPEDSEDQATKGNLDASEP